MYAKDLISVAIVLMLLTSGLSLIGGLAGNDTPPLRTVSSADTDPGEMGDTAEPAPETGTRSSRYIDKNLFTDNAQLTLIGANAYDYAGFSLAYGDIDNDGYDDLLVGAPYGDGAKGDPRDASGEVMIIFGDGNQTFPGTTQDFASGEFDIAIYGREGSSGGGDSGDLVGYSVASGDINGDGYDDIIMGAPGAELSDRTDAGAVYVLYGDQRSQLAKEIDLLTDLDFAIYGTYDETYLGRTLAVGDFNNDQYDDIMVSDMYADPYSRTDAGLVYVVMGGSSLGTHEDLWRDNRSPDTIVIVGDKGRTGQSDPGDNAGSSLGVGDVNGDSIDDMLIGAYGGQPGGGRLNSGAAYVILGSSSVGNYYDLRTDARVDIWGADANDYLGAAIDGADVNGDGIDDILVGAFYGDGQANNKGYAGEMYVIYGSTNLAQTIDTRTTYGVAVWGRTAGDLLGSGIASGDLNGDIYEDFIVGARQSDADDAAITDAGAAYVFYGSASLGKNLDPKNDGDGQLYGDNASTLVGYALAAGDMDNDGTDDIAVTGYTADGELNARDNCGEVYVVYGKAPPVSINSVVLLDGSGNPTSTVYSRYDTYKFRVNLTMIIGTADLDEVTIDLDPQGANLQFRYSTGPTKFTKVKDTAGLTQLKSVAGSARTTGPFYYEIDFELEIGWDYPTDGMLPVEVTAAGFRSPESTATFTDVFEVEDDLEFYGELKVWDEEGSLLEEDRWVAGGETLVFTGLTPVYQGTTDVYPPDGDFTVMVTDDTNSWSNSTATGDEIYIEPTLGPVTNPEDLFTVGFSKPETNSPRGTVTINLSVDGEMPDPPTSVKFYRELLTSDDVSAVNTTEFVMKWPEGDDSFSGIRGYYYSLENGENTAEGTFTTETYAELSGVPTGLVKYYVWSVDNAGNIGKAVSGSVLVDLEAPEFKSFEPAAGTWQITPSFNCTIIIDDNVGSGIDTTSIRYRISTRGISGYGSWLSVTDIELVTASSIKASVRISGDFDDGTDNYIRFKLKDEAGNNFVSDDFNIKLDTAPVEFLDEAPDSLAKQAGGDVVFEITVADTVSDVDLSSIQYRLSTSGAAGYGAWTAENLYPTSAAGGTEYGIKYRVDLSLPPGKSNYIKFRARDNAGNIYRESQDFRIWVNSPPQAVISSPITDSIFKENKAVPFSSSGSADADNDTLSYKWRSSIDGEFGYQKDVSWDKLSPGIHEITLEVTDGISTQESRINVEIRSEDSEESAGMFGGSQTVDMIVFVILIIVIALIAVLFLRSRKQLKDKEEEARRVTPAELVTPGIAGVAAGPGMRPGVTDADVYGLQPGAGGTAAPAYPQLPGTGAPQVTPAYDYGVPVAAAGAAGGVPQPHAGAAPETGVVRPAAPQLPPAVSAEYPHLNAQQKLDLLEEKFLTGQISENLYMQLKSKYQDEMSRGAGLQTPTGETGGESRQTEEASAAELTFKKPGEQTVDPGSEAEAGPGSDDWGSDEDVLSRIQIPGKEESTGPDLEKLAYPGKVKKIKKQ